MKTASGRSTAIAAARRERNRTLDAKTRSGQPGAFRPVFEAMGKAHQWINQNKASPRSREEARRIVARAAIKAGLTVPDQNTLLALVDGQDFAAKPLTATHDEIYRRLAGGKALAEAVRARKAAEQRMHARLGDVEHRADKESRFDVIAGHQLPKATATLYFRILRARKEDATALHHQISRAPLGKFQKSRLRLMLNEKLEAGKEFSASRAEHYLPYLTEKERQIEKLRESAAHFMPGAGYARGLASTRSRRQSPATKAQAEDKAMPSPGKLKKERILLRIPGVRKEVSKQIILRMMNMKRSVGANPNFEDVFHGLLGDLPPHVRRRLRRGYTTYLGKAGEHSVVELLQIAGAKRAFQTNRFYFAGGAKFGIDALMKYRLEIVDTGGRNRLKLKRNAPGQNTAVDVKTGPHAKPTRHQRTGHAATSPDKPARPAAQDNPDEVHYTQLLRQGFHETSLKTFQRSFKDSLKRQGILTDDGIEQVMRNLAMLHRISAAKKQLTTAEVIAFTIMSVSLMADVDDTK